jgi:hypothetical protein
MIKEHAKMTRITCELVHEAARVCCSDEKLLRIMYYALEINDEAGEIVGKVKKLFRDNGGMLNKTFAIKVLDVCGDVLWPMVRLLDELGLTLEDALKQNKKNWNHVCNVVRCKVPETSDEQ